MALLHTELTSRELEGEGPYESQNCLRPSNVLAMCPWVENADDAQLSCHSSHTDNVNGSSTEISACRVSKLNRPCGSKVSYGINKNQLQKQATRANALAPRPRE